MTMTFIAARILVERAGHPTGLEVEVKGLNSGGGSMKLASALRTDNGEPLQLTPAEHETAIAKLQSTYDADPYGVNREDD